MQDIKNTDQGKYTSVDHIWQHCIETLRRFL